MQNKSNPTLTHSYHPLILMVYRRIKEEKEKEIQRLREMQEKANDRLAEMDALRAKRATEANDRAAR